MNYTIVTLEAVGRESILDISKDGNQYTVGIYDRESHSSATKTFKTLDEAEKVFMKFSSYFIRGMYSTADRMEMLRNEV